MNMPETTTRGTFESARSLTSEDQTRLKSGSPQPLQNGSRVDDILRGSRIAIIDDEPINVEAVREHLRIAGYRQFFTTTDSTKAVDLIRKERPDVVLLDIMMPQVSGLDILNEMRQSRDLFDLPVIILTAATDREMKLQALENGATEFLTKPLDTVELLVRLKNVLGMKAHFDRLKEYVKVMEHEVEAVIGSFETIIDKQTGELAQPLVDCPAEQKASAGIAFNPTVVDSFFERVDQIIQVCREHQSE